MCVNVAGDIKKQKQKQKQKTKYKRCMFFLTRFNHRLDDPPALVSGEGHPGQVTQENGVNVTCDPSSFFFLIDVDCM
jgi:hypothetical protein